MSVNSGTGTTKTARGLAHGKVKITAKWGWDAVPYPIEVAILILASRLYARRGDGQYGTLTAKDVDDVGYRWAGASGGLDDDVLTTVAPFRRHWAAA